MRGYPVFYLAYRIDISSLRSATGETPAWFLGGVRWDFVTQKGSPAGRVFCKLSCPLEGEAEVGEFGGDVGEEASTELEGFVQDAKDVLAHF